MNDYRFDRLKILLVDDNAHMRKLITTILHAFGVSHIYEADTAKQAWGMLRECNVDVIFVDWVMEGMSGIELAKMIRTSPSSPNPFVPMIMLTGHTQIEHVREARDAGINEFLAKPASVNAVLMRLIAVIDQPRPFVRTTSYFGPCRRRRDEEYYGPERRTTKEPDAADAASFAAIADVA